MISSTHLPPGYEVPLHRSLTDPVLIAEESIGGAKLATLLRDLAGL